MFFSLTRSFYTLGLLALIVGAAYFIYQYFSPQALMYGAPVRDQLPALEAIAPKAAAVELIFTGDVMLGRHVEVLSRRHTAAYIIKGIAPFFTTKERIVITNFESAMASPHVPSPSGSFQFSTATSTLAVLEALTVNFASLANNHTLDYGAAGFKTTVKALADRGIVAFGHPITVNEQSVAYIEAGEYTVGLLGIHTLFSNPSREELKTVIDVMKERSDFQVAYVHWGNEYELVHSRAQATLAADLVAAGIDAVVGHHPHVTQDIQLIGDVPVFYSLGNFIFDQYFSVDVQQGYLLGLTLAKDEVTYRLYPHSSELVLSQPVLMGEEESATYLEAVAARSAATLRPGISQGTFTLPLATE